MTEASSPARIRYTSELFEDHLEELESLLFFNESQADYREVIIESIERFGEPRIRHDRGRLRLHTTELGEVQALYAVEDSEEVEDVDRPIAAAVYARTAQATVTLLHIAVNPEFAADGPLAGQMVGLKLVSQVMASVSRIKGVEHFVMLYGPGREAGTTLPVRRRRTGR